MAAGYTLITHIQKDKLPTALDRVVDRALDLGQMELLGNLERNSPVDDTNLQNSWFPLGRSRLERLVRSSAKYAKFVNDGTGIYGPRGKLITPKTKKALAFEYKGAMVVVKSVKGIKPRRYVEKSINETEKRGDEFIIRAAMEAKGLL